MLRADEIWDILQARLCDDRWVSLQEIYDVVERHAHLARDDFEPSAPGNNEPKWLRNVRNVLQSRKGTGYVEWDGHGHYRLMGGARRR